MLTDDITNILRKRAVLDEDASIRGITLGPKTSSTEELADMIEAAILDVQNGTAEEIEEFND